jgi:hypothetical protein
MMRFSRRNELVNLPGGNLMRYIFWHASIAAVLLLSACSLEDRIPAEMVQMDQSRPVGNETSLDADVRLDIGSVEISGETGTKLYAIDLEYDKAGYQPEINYDQSGTRAGRLSLRLESSRKMRSQRHTNRLRLNLTNSMPLRLQVNNGVGESRFSLTGLRLTHLDLEAGVGGAKISSYEPNLAVCDEIRLRNGVGALDAVGLGNLNFRRLDFEGGVGGANLDFSGAWKQDAEVRIQVGLGGVTARIPRGIGVRVSAEKHFLSGLQLDGFRREGGEDYYSENYDRAKVHITVVVQTGIGGFKISWI